MLEVGSPEVLSRIQILIMQTVRVRLADISFRKVDGHSVRDEEQFKKLVKNNTRSNGRVQWAVIEKQFCPKDRHCWGATTASALRHLHNRRIQRNRYDRIPLQFKQDHEDNAELSDELSDDNLSDSGDTIDISPNFDGFDRALPSH